MRDVHPGPDYPSEPVPLLRNIALAVMLAGTSAIAAPPKITEDPAPVTNHTLRFQEAPLLDTTTEPFPGAYRFMIPLDPPEIMRACTQPERAQCAPNCKAGIQSCEVNSSSGRLTMYCDCKTITKPELQV